jgi:S-adenosyl-L-methionine hydrolase (adenosine-forming)
MPAPGLRYETVTFLSDYGLVDEFVGVVHAVIRSIAPDVGVVDLTHHVPVHDVRAGGLTLARSAQYLNPGVVLAVVDPGVGSDRRSVAVEVGDGASILIGPDNGVLAPAVAICGGATRAVELANPEYQLPSPGPTFAGRDIFAPAAAHLCLGLDLTDLGPLIDPVTLLPGTLPVPYEEEATLVAEVLWVDHFGNAQLNIGPDELDDLEDPVRVEFGGERRTARRVSHYGELRSGEVGLMIDSYGLVSLVTDQMSAAAELGLDPSNEVRLTPIPDDEVEAPSVISTTVSLTRKADGAPREGSS